MPVAIGNELKLEDNKVNAEYGELFRKMNVARAWTNTTTTESGGTVSVINNEGTILDNMSSGYNDWYVPSYSSICIIDGKLYRLNNGSLRQIGESSNWKMCTTVSFNGNNAHLYAINSSNELYYFDGVNDDGTYTSSTKVTSPSSWSYITRYYGISNGKLYKLNETTATQIGELNGWEKISDSDVTSIGLCNGCVYLINDTTTTILSANNDFVDIESSGVASSSIQTAFAINTNGELYYRTNGDLIKSNFTGTVKQISDGRSQSQADACLVTTDGKLYYSVDDTWYELGAGKNWVWSDRGPGTSTIYAIGDNKLWKVTPNTSGGTMTQVGSSSGYKKVFGGQSSSTNVIILAWTGNATHTETTIYTTQHPKTSDKTYSDLNLTQYGTVTAYTGSSITSNSKVFDSDISKNGSFTAIPAATVHETVSVADILRATE